jgi:hypothetical protein
MGTGRSRTSRRGRRWLALSCAFGRLFVIDRSLIIESLLNVDSRFVIERGPVVRENTGFQSTIANPQIDN